MTAMEIVIIMKKKIGHVLPLCFLRTLTDVDT